MKICSRCGNNLTWNRSFCPLCGGFLVEKPDEIVSGHSVEQAPYAARQGSVPAPQPQTTPPPNPNQEAEARGMTMPSSESPSADTQEYPIPQVQQPAYPPAPQADAAPPVAFAGPAPAEPVKTEAAPPASAPQPVGIPYPAFQPPAPAEPYRAEPAPPAAASQPDNIYPVFAEPAPQAETPDKQEGFQLREDLSAIAGGFETSSQSIPGAAFGTPPPMPEIPDSTWSGQQTSGHGSQESEKRMPGSAQAPLQPDLSAGAYQPPSAPQQPKTAGADHFLGIMKGSSGGRVELIPQKPQIAEPIEKPDATTDEVKAHANAPYMDMFNRKREGVMPQPEIQEAAQPIDQLKPGVADSVRVVGFTLPVQEPPNAAEPAGTSPPLLPQEGVGQLFPEAAPQPPAPQVPTQRPIEAAQPFHIQQPPAPMPPQLAPAMPQFAVTPPPPPAAPTAPATPQPGVTLPQVSAPQSMPVPPSLGVTPQAQPPVPPAPIMSQPVAAPTQVPPPPMPTPPGQLFGVTPQATPTIPTPPPGVTFQAQPPAPPAPIMSQPGAAPPQVPPPPMPTPPGQLFGVTPQATPTIPTPPPGVMPQATPTAPPPLPTQQQQAAPGVQQAMPQPAMSKFAELIPKQQTPSEAAGQPLPAPEPPKAPTAQAKAKSADSFPNFQMGEFLKMFPEAKPD